MSNSKISIDELQTGDIILFSNNRFWFSKLVEWWTGTKWSHVGMILRDPTYINPVLQGVYLWESGVERTGDCEDNKHKFGVQITDFEKLLNPDNEKYKYAGHIVARRLYCKGRNLDATDEQLINIHNVVHNKPYDVSLLDFIEANMDVSKIEKNNKHFICNHRKTNKFFCSALVGYIYTQLGLLPNTTNWTECEPAFFSSDNDKLILKNAELGSEMQLQ